MVRSGRCRWYSRCSSAIHEDLPQPVGPTNATFCPGSTTNEMPFSTGLRRSVGYRKTTSRNSIFPLKRSGRSLVENMARTGYSSCAGTMGRFVLEALINRKSSHRSATSTAPGRGAFDFSSFGFFVRAIAAEPLLSAAAAKVALATMRHALHLGSITTVSQLPRIVSSSCGEWAVIQEPSESGSICGLPCAKRNTTQNQIIQFHALREIDSIGVSHLESRRSQILPSGSRRTDACSRSIIRSFIVKTIPKFTCPHMVYMPGHTLHCQPCHEDIHTGDLNTRTGT